jgi:hypothetical protein
VQHCISSIPDSVCSNQQRWSAESTSRFFHLCHPRPCCSGSFDQTLCQTSTLPFCGDVISIHRIECEERNSHIQSNIMQIFHQVCHEAVFRNHTWVACDFALILVEEIAYGAPKVHLQVVNIGDGECGGQETLETLVRLATTINQSVSDNHQTS